MSGAATPPPPPTPASLGPPLPLTDGDLDGLSAYSAADIQRALAVWRRDALPAARALLDAPATS